MRLSRAALGRVPADIAAPHGRAPLRTGIVHFGPGAFHRAHQAAFVDRLLDDDPRWGIAAVALRSREMVTALAEQDGLYTLAVRDRDPALRVIGAHSAFFGPDDGAAVHALLADPAVALVTATVTEKGYCLSADGTLDLAHPDIVHDLADAANPRSLVGWLAAGLAARRAAALPPFVAMPCDNLADNGRKLKDGLVAFAGRTDPELAAWIVGELRTPSTMVDAITPASDAALRTDVAAALELEDEAPVQREALAQWVIEDVGPFGPDLAGAGAIVTRDVAGFERAKLRILNGAHSTLAYLGLLRGHASVADAMGDARLVAFVAALVRDEILPAVGAVVGLDLPVYAETVFDRFRNPAIVHRLDQIAQDGSQKLPYRLGDTIAFHRAAGRLPVRALTAVGAWLAFVQRRARLGEPIQDPQAALLARLADTPAARALTELAAAGIAVPVALAGDSAALRVAATAATALLADGNAAIGG